MEPQPPRSRTWWVVVLGLALAWIVYLILWGPRGGSGDLSPPRLEGPRPGARADYGWTLEDLDGAAVDFARFRGQAVFLNVWATWCPPCVAELPAIENLAVRLRKEPVAFVCASVDEDPETVRRFVRERNLDLPVFVADGLPAVFQTDGIPATFVIAPDGRIVVAQVGSAQWDDPSVVDLLKTLTRSPAVGGAFTVHSLKRLIPR